MYACGLRISEAATLEIGAIDSASLRPRIIGKGDRERFAPLPQPVLEDLRRLWKTHRNPRWLFPSRAALRGVLGATDNLHRVQSNRVFASAARRKNS